MLFRLTDFLSKVDQLKKTYKGLVVDNLDPKKLGRVKVQIANLLEGDTTDLPWVYPKNPTGIGGRGDLGWFGVPRIDSELIIEFPYNDVYSGFYTGYWQSESTHQGTYDLDYPNSYGFRDSQGSEFIVSLARRLAEYNHVSGAGIGMDKEGNLELRSPKVIRLTSADRKTVLEFNMDTGEVNFNPKEGMTLGGQKTTINSGTLEVNSPEVIENIDGSRTTKISSGYNKTIAGSYGKSILSDHQVAIGGNYTELIAQQCNRTYGLGITDTIVTGGHTRTTLAGNISELITIGNYIVTALAGLVDITATAGISLTTAASISETALSKTETIATSYDITALSKSETIGTSSDVTALSKSETYTATADLTALSISLTALTTYMLQATTMATIQAPIVNVGPGALPANCLTLLTDPLIDLITGAPHIGNPTVLVG